MGQGRWLETMPVHVANVTLIFTVYRLTDAQQGRVFRLMAESWAARQAMPRPDDLEDNAWEAFESVWLRLEEYRTLHEERYRRRSEVNRKNIKRRYEKTGTFSDSDRIGTYDSYTNRTEQEQHHEQEQERTGTIVTPPVTATPSQEVTSPRAGAREQRETWLTPFGQAWERATDGQFAYSRSAKPLKRLVERHGAEAVFGAWCAYLRETETTYLSVERFAGTYGHWAGTVPEAVARGHDPNRAAVERVRLKIAARQAAAGGAP